MQISVKSSDGKPLGSIRFQDQNAVLDAIEDEYFLEFAKRSLIKGITVFHDIYDDEHDRFVMVEKPVYQLDPHFDLAFVKFLEINGYGVTVEHPELDEEIQRVLNSYPPDENKQEIIIKLPELNYLQKTFLLKELKDSENSHVG
jgi:hypothetical protein